MGPPASVPVSVHQRDESVELRAQPVGQRLGIGAQLLDRRDAEVDAAGVGQGLDEQVDRGAATARVSVCDLPCRFTTSSPVSGSARIRAGLSAPAR